MPLDFAQVAGNKKAAPKKAKAEVKPLAVIKKDATTIILKPIEAKAIIDAYLPEAKKITAEALKMKITDKESRSLVSEMGVKVKNLIKAIKKAVDDNIEEAKNYIEGPKNAGKVIIAELEPGKAHLARELLKDDERIELEKKKRDEAIRKADEERRKKLEEEAKRLNIEVPEIIEVKTKEEPEQTRTDSGVSFKQGRWTYEVMDIAKVPYKYLVKKEDSALINGEIRQGMRDKEDKDGNLIESAIPGIRIYFKKNIAFR